MDELISQEQEINAESIAAIEKEIRSPVEVRRGWAAGFIDGEGHFQVAVQKRGINKPNYYYPRICATNTDRYTLECLKLTFGGSISTTGKQKHAKWKRCFRWTVTGERAEQVARLIRPFIITKRDTVRTFLRFCEYRSQKMPSPLTLAKYRKRIRGLNRRGR